MQRILRPRPRLNCETRFIEGAETNGRYATERQLRIKSSYLLALVATIDGLEEKLLRAFLKVFAPSGGDAFSPYW